MKNITSGTIARTIVLILALLNQVLAIAGKGTIDIADDTIYQFCSLGATIITALVAWWKNNSFTTAAIAGDDAKQKAKLGIDQTVANDDNDHDKEAE